MAQESLPPSLVDFVTVNTSSGTASYEVGTTPLRILSVQIGGAVLIPTTLQRLYVSHPAWQSASNATPTHWIAMGVGAVTGNPKITLWPTPNATLAASVGVLKKPAALPSSGEILEWSDLEALGLAYYSAWRHLSLKTEVDQEGVRDLFKQNFDAIVERQRRLNSVESFNSQESGVQMGWRSQQ